MIRTHRRFSMRLMAGLAGASVLALAACSSSSSSSTAASSTSSSASASSTAAASSKVTLVVYSAQGYDSAMTKAFTEATGIPVKLDDNSTGPLLTQIEASKNNPNWGLLWVDAQPCSPGHPGPPPEGLRAERPVQQPRHRVGAGRQELHPDRRDADGGAGIAFALRHRRQDSTGRRHLSRAECRSRAQEMLSRVGLGALASRYPNELSGGEQQRVALARALIADTGLILCDEPLSNLDADLRERMRVEISALVREAAATTVYITHDQAEAFALANQVGVLERGRLVQAGTPEEIYTRPADPVRGPVHRPGRRTAGAHPRPRR